MSKRTTYIDFTESTFHPDIAIDETDCELGHYDSFGRRVRLRLNHPEVKRAKAKRDEKALIALAKRIFESESYTFANGVLRWDNIKHPPCKKCGDPVTVANWQYDRVCQSCLTALKKEPTPKNLSNIVGQNKQVDSTQMHFDFSGNEKSLRALDR